LSFTLLRHPRSPLFPYTTLFRSQARVFKEPGRRGGRQGLKSFFYSILRNRSNMLDPSQLRRDLPTVVQALKRRGLDFDVERVNALETRRKAVQVETETLQARRNAVSKLIGQLKSKGQDATAEMAESQAIPARLKELETDLAQVQDELNTWLATVPNLPHESVPAGKSEADNVEVRRWLPGPAGADGNPAPLGFEPQDHVSLGEPLGLDFESARKLSGARFMMLRGPIARLHRALAQFM